MAIHMLDAVMAKKVKGSLLTVRMDDQVYIEFAAAAALHGLSLSAFVHQYAYRTIRTEKERSPTEFARKVIEVEREIESNKKAKKSGALHPTDAEIDAEIAQLERDLRAHPDIYGIGLGGSVKVGQAQIETIIQHRLAKRRAELLKQRQDKRVVDNKRRQDRQQTNVDPSNLTDAHSPHIERLTNEDNNETQRNHTQSPPAEEKKQSRKANMKSPAPPTLPIEDTPVISPHKMRNDTLTGKKKREPLSEAAEQDVADAKELVRKREQDKMKK